MNNLFDFSNLPLTQLSSTYAQASIWLEEKMDKQIATFDVVIRGMPKKQELSSLWWSRGAGKLYYKSKIFTCSNTTTAEGWINN